MSGEAGETIAKKQAVRLRYDNFLPENFSVTFRDPETSRLANQLPSEGFLADCHWQSSPASVGDVRHPASGLANRRLGGSHSLHLTDVVGSKPYGLSPNINTHQPMGINIW